MTQAGSSAGFHLRFVNDSGAVLQVDANSGTFVFVDRMTHAEATEATGVSVECRPRRASQETDRGKGNEQHGVSESSHSVFRHRTFKRQLVRLRVCRLEVSVARSLE